MGLAKCYWLVLLVGLLPAPRGAAKDAPYANSAASSVSPRAAARVGPQESDLVEHSTYRNKSGSVVHSPAASPARYRSAHRPAVAMERTASASTIKGLALTTEASMRGFRVRVEALLCLLLLGVPTASFSANWIPVTPLAGGAVSYDSSTFQVLGPGRMQFWLLVRYERPHPVYPGSATPTFVEMKVRYVLDCNNQTLATLASNYTDGNGDVVASSENSYAQAKSIVPDSLGDVYLAFFCKKQ